MSESSDQPVRPGDGPASFGGDGPGMDELHRSAQRNRMTFDEVLASYVQAKLRQLLDQRARGVRGDWFDASGCVWCVFDDPLFERSGDAATQRRSCDGARFDMQVFWSMGDVVMPEACDADWVAARIAEEAQAQLAELGFRCKEEQRMVDGEPHRGVRLRTSRLPWRR